MVTDFQPTMQAGPAFDKTQPMHLPHPHDHRQFGGQEVSSRYVPVPALSGTDRHRQNGEGTLPPHGMYKLAQNASEDKSMWFILIVLAAWGVIWNLPKFGWFQELTAIHAWIPFIKNVLGLL
jgi:hypothetical protein